MGTMKRVSKVVEDLYTLYKGVILMIDYEYQLIKRRSQYIELRNKKLVRQLTIDPSEDVRLCELRYLKFGAGNIGTVIRVGMLVTERAEG